MLDDMLARLGGMTADDRTLIRAQVTESTGLMRWVPSPGPQTDAYFSKADVLLYGGQGGGGKSDLGLGLASTAHQRSAIFRRKYTNLGALIDRAKEINQDRANFNGSPPPRLITADQRIIDFGAMLHLGDEQDWQGKPYDFKHFDEAVQFLELQVRFQLGWLRSAETSGSIGEADTKQRTRALLATNPPIDASGDWIIGMFRPWLDVTHANPAKHGELRWFITDETGNDVEVDGPEPRTLYGHTYIPHSRTFIAASLSDNPFLANTGYQAQLDALPEPIRSAVRDGNFMAGRLDAEWQVIPTNWVLEAVARHTDQPPPGVPMCAMGADIAQGGADNTVVANRYDGWYAPLIIEPGINTPTPRDSVGVIVKHRRDSALPVVDVGGGYGGGVVQGLEDNGIKAVAYNGSHKSNARTEDKKLNFINKRAEAHWKFREALDPSQPGGSPIALPHDPVLIADLTAPTFAVTPNGIKVESKDDIKKRIGRSPDRGDAVIMAWSTGDTATTHAHIWQSWKYNPQNPQGMSQRPVHLGHDAKRRR